MTNEFDIAVLWKHVTSLFDKPKFQAPPREKREVAFDPDSPFAALAVLKNRKPE